MSDSVIMRRIGWWLAGIKFWIGAKLARPLTKEEWEGLERTHPKIWKSYVRGILTEKETAYKVRNTNKDER